MTYEIFDDVSVQRETEHEEDDSQQQQLNIDQREISIESPEKSKVTILDTSVLVKPS